MNLAHSNSNVSIVYRKNNKLNIARSTNNGFVKSLDGVTWQVTYLVTGRVIVMYKQPVQKKE